MCFNSKVPHTMRSDKIDEPRRKLNEESAKSLSMNVQEHVYEPSFDLLTRSGRLSYRNDLL